MASELGQISFYLAKKDSTFDTVIKDEKIQAESDSFKIKDLVIENVPVKFFCMLSQNSSASPPWLNFINDQIQPPEDKIDFSTYSERISGLLLIKIKNRILAACFGVSGKTLLRTSQMVSDFGIITAMNLCGNQRLRQTKSSSHEMLTQNIDRQLSKPSDTFSFRMSDFEYLRYISAHLEKNQDITLQGKDNLTLKAIRESKFDWHTLIKHCKTFIEEYKKDDYTKLFPNYPNFREITDTERETLDELLMERLQNQEYDQIHLAIPEFIPDDEYSFVYDKLNYVFSHIDINHFSTENLINKRTSIKALMRKKIYAHSQVEDQTLTHKYWSFYSCIVAEVELDGSYYVLSNGTWKKVDDDFFTAIESFIENDVPEIEISDKCKNINIFNPERKQNREENFNTIYCERNDNAGLFDQAKLRIGVSRKDKEFCDIIELDGDKLNIIHVKKHGGSSSLAYLFSQSRFYCDAFLTDANFLQDIRNYIKSTDKIRESLKPILLNYIKENQADVIGSDYNVGMWILYDKTKKQPTKQSLPLMVKYEIKKAFETLRNVLKYHSVTLSMVPVSMGNSKVQK